MADEEEVNLDAADEGGGGGSYEDRARAAASDVPPKEKGGGGGGGADGPDPDAWMVTFSDLLTLLMTFFVLIFASADPVEDKLFEAFGQSDGVFGLFRTSFFQEIKAVQRRDISQDRLEVFLDEIGASEIDVVQDEQGLTIVLPSQAYFTPGSTQLTAAAKTRIGELSKMLRHTKHGIRVQGHSDDREARRTNYPSGWELSVARGHRVLQELLAREMDPKRMSVGGYGSERPRFSNLSRKGREKNRRVEIVILNRGGVP